MQGIANFFEWLSTVVKVSLAEIESDDGTLPEEVHTLEIDADAYPYNWIMPGYVHVSTETHNVYLNDYGQFHIQAWHCEQKDPVVTLF